MNKLIDSTLSIPENFNEEMIPTLNGTGFMMTKLDKYSQQFVEYAAKQSEPVLEVGAAYGLATIKALAAGAKVIANDIDKKQLDILEEQTPDEYLDRLTLMPGSFPEDLQFKSSSLAGVLASNVLHFFDGNKLEKAVQKLYNWLKPDAKVFITTLAPTSYLVNYAKPLISIYEENLKSGKKWPGYITGIKNSFMQEPALQGFAQYVPDIIHLLEPKVLSRLFKQVGFTIEVATTFERPWIQSEMKLDGIEYAAVIAVKNC